MNARNAILLAAALFTLTLITVPAARAQVPYNEGTVERTVLLHINPGHAQAVYTDFKTNIIPLWETEKSAGLIVDYHIFLNLTTSSSDDWDFGYSIVYKNMAALDGIGDKVYPLRMKQYGGSDAEQQVISKRVENAHIVVSNLSRDITLR